MSDVKPNRREMYAALTKAAVLDAAKSLFVDKGFTATSVEDIARLAHASKGAVYHHFSDKQAIFAEVFRTAQNAVLLQALRSMTAASTPWEQIETGTRAFLRECLADHEAMALLRQVMEVLGWDRVRAIDEEAAMPFLRATLAELVKTGEIRDVPLEAAAELIYSVYCNAILYVAAAADPERATAEMEKVIFVMLDGFRNTPARD